MAQNDQMTYKQAIKILSEVKVSDLPYNGCQGNQKAWDIARRMAVQALKEKEQAELAQNSNNNPEAKMKTKCNVGDTLYVLTADSLNGIEETKCSKITKVHLADIGDAPKYHAPCVYDDWGGATWEFYDNDFGVKVFLTRKDAEIARDMNGSNNSQIAPCKVGDVIPYQICSGRVIYYIVEKIKVRENGDLKIRCKHGGGGANRSFTREEAFELIKNNGKIVGKNV